MKRSPDFVLRRVGGQDFLVPMGEKVRDMNALITLNATGRSVWELLAEDRTPDDLIAAVADRFDGAPERIRADVLAFLDDLSRKGLIQT
jgi:hypothetical protein